MRKDEAMAWLRERVTLDIHDHRPADVDKIDWSCEFYEDLVEALDMYAAERVRVAFTTVRRMREVQRALDTAAAVVCDCSPDLVEDGHAYGCLAPLVQGLGKDADALLRTVERAQ